MSRHRPNTPDPRIGPLIALLAVASLVAAGLPAQADHGSGGEARWVVTTHVDADVHENYAQVDVTATIENRDVDPEFPFRVRLPEDALVTGLTVTRDGETYEATVEPADQARDEYEEHKAEDETAGLVERSGSGDVYEFLVNVEGTETVEATLTYETYLRAESGRYTLPLEAPATPTGHDQGATFDVRVTHAAGVRDVAADPAGADVHETSEGWTVEHSVGSRGDETRATPLNVSYALEPTPEAGSLAAAIQGGEGYFAHWIHAEPQDEDLPLDVALVLDTSGSMSGQKIDQLRNAARQLVSRLDAGDRIQIVPFSSQARPAWDGLRAADEATRTDAYEVLDDLAATGSTNIEDGLRTGLRDLGEASSRSGERVQVAALLSDGRPTTGAQSADGLREVVRQEGAEGLPIFALAFGDGADWGLTYGLAEETDGYADRVPADGDAEVDLRRFFARLATPVVRDVSVTYEGDVTSYRTSSPVLFRGSEILVVGRFDGSRETLEGEVQGVGADGPYTASFGHDVADGAGAGDGFLPRLVAYQRIQSLQDRIDAVGETEELVGKVQGMALEHGFVTDYTSLVVTLPHQEEPQRMRPAPERDGGEAGDLAHDRGQGVPLLPGPAAATLAAILAGVALGVSRRRRS